jgi:predicted ATPase
MIKSIKLKNLLSFGDPGLDLELKPLNVLIGPNGSGKSNLIDAISLLQAAPRDIAEPIRRGGGVEEWRSKINSDYALAIQAVIEIDAYFDKKQHAIAHTLVINERVPRGLIMFESISTQMDGVHDEVFRFRYGEPVVLNNAAYGTTREIEKYDQYSSALSQLRGSEVLEISLLAVEYDFIRVYRDWTFGRNAAARKPQRADDRKDFLSEDASNLGLILNKFRSKSPTKKKILVELRNLLDGVTDFDVSVEGGTVQLFLEEYSHAIPSTRLSDGTLRYLALLAILCDPEPPRVVCIEEPELGMV